MSKDQESLPVSQAAGELKAQSGTEGHNASPTIATSEKAGDHGADYSKVTVNLTSYNSPGCKIVPEAQEQNDASVLPRSEKAREEGEDYSVLTVDQKRATVLAASLLGFFSPLSGSIYFPALSTIAKGLDVTTTQVNLSVTTYMIVQGLAPMITAGFSDGAGRRPAYMICFVVYMAANLGLALQNNYAALMVLRCLQSGGSSGTIALANGVVGDIITSAERGSYVGYASVASILGPSLSPILGGVIAQYWNWHGIFWFLLALAGAAFVPMLLFMPETCRKVVGNGSIPPPPLNQNLTDKMRHAKRAKAGITVDEEKLAEVREQYSLKFPNPLVTLVVLAELETALVLSGCGLAIALYYATPTGMSILFKERYGFDDLRISLMFLPIGAGGIISAFTTGKAVDWNYRRHARRLNLPVVKNRQQDTTNFPFEQARLEVAMPLFYVGAATVIAYGWIMEQKVSLAGPVIILFFMGWSLTAAFQILNVLMVDIYPGRPAVATAANNIVRCLLGAAASAAIAPMIGRMGPGWAYTTLAFIFIAYSPVLFVVMRYGMKWRQERKAKVDRKNIQVDQEGRNTDEGIEVKGDSKG